MNAHRVMRMFYFQPYAAFMRGPCGLCVCLCPCRMGGRCMNRAVITLEGVNVRYGRAVALHDISAVFAEGTLVALAGPNGAGKSTLLKVIAGIVRPSAGHVDVDRCFRRSIAYLPQGSGLKRDFPLSVMQVVCTGFLQATGERKPIDTAMRKLAAQALADVGLEGFEERMLDELSGGQLQRTLFAATDCTGCAHHFTG